MAEFQFNFLSPYSLTFISDDHDLNPPRVSGMDQVFFQTFFKTEVLVRKVNQFGLTAESGAGCCSIIYRELSLWVDQGFSTICEPVNYTWFTKSWVHDLACRILKFQDLTCKHWNFNIWHAEYYRFWPAEYWRYDMQNIPLSRSDMLFLSPCMFLCNDQWYGVRKW